MTLERGLRPTSPVHVLVDDSTPVHVHMMKRARKPKSAAPNGSGNRRPRSTRRAVPTVSKARARSSSPRAGPWVPAPGKSTRGTRVTWQVLEDGSHGNTRRAPPRTRKSGSKSSRAQGSKSPTHRLVMPTTDHGELSTEDEDAVHGQMIQYEDKIDKLMSHVGTLKNEVELQRALQELDTKDQMLDTSHRTIEKQEATLKTIESELNDREHENYLLRKSVDITKTEKEYFNREREQLMKKLIEVEMDGQAAQQHVRELRDLIRRLREDNRIAMTSAESVRLNKLKEAFFEKMADFEAANRALRRLLREHHRSEGEAVRLLEQREVLLKKVADGDAYNERLRIELQDRDRAIDDLRGQVMAQREESAALGNLQDSLETTRGHLQKQLRTKEADCNRMAVQIRTLEGQLAQNKLEVDHLQDLVATAKQRADNDKDALKKATRRVDELECLVDRVENNSKTQVESLTVRLHEKSSDVTTLKLENERLKCPRMDRSRREADESMVMLEDQQKESSRLHHTSEIELEKVKARLHQRLQELEPLPELLRTTELRLHEANEKLLQYERRNSDNTKLIAELTAKVESRGEAVDGLRLKFSDSQEESRLMHSKMDAMDHRIRELDEANKELATQGARKEEALHQLNLRLEEKGRESGVLTRQLENALSDLRQQQDNARDRFASKERTYQSRVVDLESQLSQCRTEIARIKREKEENERKFNSRLFDLKDRLEQCHSTNRSMQNYVQFLKNSYANVFGETTTTTATTHYGPPPPLKHTLP